MKVLLLEDDFISRELIKTVLNSLTTPKPIVILEAETNDQAKALWQQHQADLVLCDWTLADNSTGLELVKFIRRSDKTTPILMITGRSDRQTVMHCLQQGATDFIVKPFDPAKLNERLRGYVPKQTDKPAEPLPPLLPWLRDIKARLTPPPTLGGTRDLVRQLSRGGPPGAQDLAKDWRSSTAITTRLVHVANSGMLKRYGKSVNNLVDAIAAMGTTMAMQQVLALSLNQQDQLSHPDLARHAQRLCQQGERIAATATSLARQLKVNMAQSYTAGLLYPLGELALLQRIQAYADQDGIVDSGAISSALEELGWDYSQALQQLWRLPIELRERLTASRHLPDRVVRPDLILMKVAVDQVFDRTDNEEHQRLLGLLGLEKQNS